MSSDLLLPCPFCGGDAERIDIEDGNNAGGSFVHCTNCDASGNVEFGFKENFISNWNRRTYFKRQALAWHLATLDGVTLTDVRSTVGPAEDASNWRQYLGRADDLLALISAGMGE